MNLHHIWCNFSRWPRADCKQCERLFREYPYEGLNAWELARKHFPDAIPKTPEPIDAIPLAEGSASEVRK